MRGNKAVVGVFSYVDDVLKAVKRVQEANLDYKVYSPVPNHDIENLTLPDKSPVRFVTLFGALCGITGGFALAIYCAMDYPMRVSAKDVVSIPGFVVIGYECTILLGGIFTMLALLHFCRIPDIFRKVGYDPRFSDNKFGVVVGCEKGDLDQVRSVLSESGAEEVEVRDGL
ncbi:MAG: DUF3341 domain-containing protein [Deltaproteobacteria bacterium]|nr:DUF3341 domain-containing protein [Deltaproteobacteria bacterium]